MIDFSDFSEHFRKILFDLDEGFGNFLNCTIEEKSPFETESAISPAISVPMLK